MEALGRHYAIDQGLKVVCIRFGGVNPENTPDIPFERRIWLSHDDCVSLVRASIEADSFAERFCIVYGVSDNQNRPVDVTNPLGWQPKDSF